MTRLPVGAVEGDLAAASWAFPLAGLLVGGVAALIYGFAIDLGLSALLAAALAVASAMLLTGALHEDGLADFADGLGVRGGPAERLAAMRASGIGSFGTLALVFSVLLRVAALAALVGPAAVGPALIGAHAGARALLPWAMHGQPQARADGLRSASAVPRARGGRRAPDRSRHPASCRRTGPGRNRRPAALLGLLILPLARRRSAASPGMCWAPSSSWRRSPYFSLWWRRELWWGDDPDPLVVDPPCAGDEPWRAIYGQNDLPADCADSGALPGAGAQLPADALWLVTPLRRTCQTAEALFAAGAPPPAELREEPDFLEQHFGSWQGLTYDELAALRDGAAHRFWHAPAVERRPVGRASPM